MPPTPMAWIVCHTRVIPYRFSHKLDAMLQALVQLPIFVGLDAKVILVKTKLSNINGYEIHFHE